MSKPARNARHRVKRLHDRGHYDRDTINQVLDSGYVCHVGYNFDGSTYVTPTIYWRDGERVYWHGSSASRMLRSTANADVCFTVTHVDGLVLARSSFHHSLNYRSVMIFGEAELLDNSAEKAKQLQLFVEQLYPGRWPELRALTDQELKATTVLSLPIVEASAKIRSGHPVDEEEDYDLPVWAGVIPLSTQLGTPIACPRLDPAIPLPQGFSSEKFG